MCGSNDEKKRYLNGYRIAKQEEKLLQEQIEALRSGKMYPSVEQDGMPRGSGTSDLSGYAARLDELLRKLEAERLEAAATYTLIHDQINAVEEPVEREVLRRRYLLMQRWEEIAIEMNFNYRWVLRLHGRALNHFEISETGH